MNISAELSLRLGPHYEYDFEYGKRKSDALVLEVRFCVPGRFFRVKLVQVLCKNSLHWKKDKEEFTSKCEEYLSDDYLIKRAAEKMIIGYLIDRYVVYKKADDPSGNKKIAMLVKDFNKKNVVIEVKYNPRR